MRVALTTHGAVMWWAAIWMWAQADPKLEGALVGGGIFSLVIQTGSFALVAYLIIFSLPAMQKELRAERKEEREAFTKSLKESEDARKVEREASEAARKQERTDFLTALEKNTTTKDEEVKEMRVEFRDEQKETRAFFAAESGATRQIYMDAIAAFRTAVHDVKDTANATVQKANVAIKLAEIEAAKKGNGGTS